MHFFRGLFKRKREKVASPSVAPVSSPIARRLAEEFALLQQIDFERSARADFGYGRATEDRVIWRELFDLELQEVDEQVSRGSFE